MGRIHTLHIENFRAIGSLDYAPRQLNIICGKNNTGKTALLDAIYINRTGGARRRFFEEGIIENLIKTDKSKAIVHSNLNHVKIYRSLNIIRNEDPKAYDQIRDYIIQILLMDVFAHLILIHLAHLKVIHLTTNLVFSHINSVVAIAAENLCQSCSVQVLDG